MTELSQVFFCKFHKSTVGKLKTKIEPERRDPGEAQRDLHGALLLLWQPVRVRVGEMGSHVLRIFGDYLEIIVLSSLVKFCPKPFSLRLEEMPWLPSAPTTSPPRHQGGTAASVLTHEPGVLLCPLRCPPVSFSMSSYVFLCSPTMSSYVTLMCHPL